MKLTTTKVTIYLVVEFEDGAGAEEPVDDLCPDDEGNRAEDDTLPVFP